VIPLDTWLLFCLACAALAATPGPNMLFLVSRTLAQGRAAGFVSLAGTSSGFALHALAAAFGLSALLAAVPLAFEVVKWAGAIYLAWLAIQMWRASDEPEATVAAPHATRRAMYRQGLLTAVLNPKVAVFQLALFPQFVDPARGGVFTQSLVLGAMQIAISVVGDAIFVLTAAGVASWIARRPTWMAAQRWVLATVFVGIAAKLALDERR
jgi:threonine/homoserine/homoserine lactone efflux protein